ncbi:hypothetical protein [Candidatus Nitrotoga sp. M5]|uniref:hypothetical protein n=1 Tax=Candidatus Nitrotoga sp. M5 TaxID=2890409 RepID=UPI001EF1667B|nr:hypothetical protein [Candidatus Nitrotoga sp. M5]CAH1385253.1 conserved exported hypothetical protein [Candidatus Nitrotoga sp. M5]
MRLLLLVFFIGIISPASADIFTPYHSCSKPYRPYVFNHQYEIDSFKHEVETYKQCINDFVEEQNNAVRKHQNAAKEAIDEWNGYVNRKLN